MKKARVYLDTSVIGGCLDEEFSTFSLQLVDETKGRRKSGYISDIVIQELELAPQQVVAHFEEYAEFLVALETSDEVLGLAEAYIEDGVITELSYNDATHIALATVNNLDVLCSWNFKHIVNYNRIVRFNAVNLKMGYKGLAIYSPREVIEDET